MSDISAEENEFHVFGGSRPGIPFVHHGHNSNISWILTTRKNDHQVRVIAVDNDAGSHGSLSSVAIDTTNFSKGLNLSSCESAVIPADQVCGADSSDGVCTVNIDSSLMTCPVTTRVEEIKVKGSNEILIEKVRELSVGPIIDSILPETSSQKDSEKSYVLSSSVLDRKVSIRLLREMNSAASWSSMSIAIRREGQSSYRVLVTDGVVSGFIDTDG